MKDETLQNLIKLVGEGFLWELFGKEKTLKQLLWLKLTPTYHYKKNNDVWRKKYSSVISERTEENNCLDRLQHRMNVAENSKCE